MTVHDTLIIRPVLRWMSLFFFKCSGWKIQGKKPDAPRYVVIAAPHTSNWDFIFTVCLAFIFKIKPLIMMKDAWFFWPLGPIFKWLGAMPIDRSRSNNVVGQSIEAFSRLDELVLIVPPSGTRKKVSYWKTGFYRIADGAGVPIALGFLDYEKKIGGFGPMITTTGDIDSDMNSIREFYDDKTGKNPTQKSGAWMPSRAGAPR